MKVLLLSAALLLPVASAQVAMPATSATVPVATPSAPILTLNAPVGANVELLTTTTSRIKFSNVRVTALPDSNVSADDLEKVRREVAAGMAGVEDEAKTTANGKLSYRVTGQATDGSVTLLTNTVQSEPGQPPLSLKITQTVARDGRVSGLKFESDDETLNTALARYTSDRLNQLADQGGYNFSGVYGQPLTPGEASSQNHKVDMSGLLSGLFSAFASQADLPDLFGQVQSSPLSATTITTYGGLNAQGLHTLARNTKLNSWTIKVGGSGEMPSFNFNLAEGRINGTQTYRPDGLPGPSTQKTHMVMNTAIEIEGVQLKLTMTLDQTVTSKLR